MGFANAVLGGASKLIRRAIESPNFITGVSGWAINKDGSAEFSDLTMRGDFEISDPPAYIKGEIDPTLGPVISINPDSGNFLDGQIYSFEDPGDPDAAWLTIESPKGTGVGATSALLELRSGVPATPTPSLVSAGATILQGAGFVYEGTAGHDFITADTATVTPGNGVNVCSVTFDAVAGYSYQLIGCWHGLVWGTPVAVPGNRAVMRIVTGGGTQLKSQRKLGLNTTLAHNSGTIEHIVEPGSNSTVTYHLQLLHEGASTAANVKVNATATSPASLTVRGFRAA